MREREYGLDVARIAAMLGILMLHILLQGGLLTSHDPTSAKYWAYWVVEIIAYSSVDIFAMLTGWLDTNKVSKPSVVRIIELLAITVGYSVVITCLFAFFVPEKVSGIKDLIKGFFPMIVGRYWYIACYIPVALMRPYLSQMCSRISEDKHKKLCILLAMVFSIIPTFARVDLFVTKWGYSTIWLIICYIIGSYIKKIQENTRFSSYMLAGGYAFITLLLLLLKFGYWKITGGNIPGVIEYTSPFILLNAVIALLLFSRMKINKGRKALQLFSNTAFDVYILHCHLYVFDYIINRNFLWVDRAPIVVIPLLLCATAVVCYCVFSLVGIVRFYLFDKLRMVELFRMLSHRLDEILY